MNAAVANKGLGKGLQALMSDSYSRAETTPASASTNEGLQKLSVAVLVAGAYQPRRHFAESEMKELAESIAAHGVMQPILVRKTAKAYEIIAGERRWRAAQLAGLKEVPVLLRELTDAQALEIGLIENIQRKDLNPLEEGAGYRRLINEFHYTQEKLAKVVGKSRSHVANLLRLESLPERIKNYIDSGELTMGHARALISAQNPEELAEKIVQVGLSVRQAEELVRDGLSTAGSAATEKALKKAGKAQAQQARRSTTEKGEDVLQLEQMLADNLGLKVSITTYSAKAGEVVIAYESLAELDAILQRLSDGQ